MIFPKEPTSRKQQKPTNKNGGPVWPGPFPWTKNIQHAMVVFLWIAMGVGNEVGWELINTHFLTLNRPTLKDKVLLRDENIRKL